MNTNDLNAEELIIYLRELEQMKGSSEAEVWARHAVLRHRDLREGRLKVGQGHVEVQSEDNRFKRNTE
jgi:hypothetical protein